LIVRRPFGLIVDAFDVAWLFLKGSKRTGMPVKWGKTEPEEEEVEETGVDEDKYASPWARARAKEAAEAAAAKKAEEEGPIEPANLQDMSDDEWFNLLTSKMSLFFDDNQMRDRGGQKTFDSFPDYLMQNKKSNPDGEAIWAEHQRRLGIDPNYLQPTQTNDEEMVNNTVVQE